MFHETYANWNRNITGLVGLLEKGNNSNHASVTGLILFLSIHFSTAKFIISIGCAKLAADENFTQKPFLVSTRLIHE